MTKQISKKVPSAEKARPLTAGKSRSSGTEKSAKKRGSSASDPSVNVGGVNTKSNPFEKKAGTSAKKAASSKGALIKKSVPANNRRKAAKGGKKSTPLKIISLGGLDEIGKNMTVYEYGSDIFIIDCGMTFPDAEMPGVDIVIPDFSYVVKNADRVKGLVITHGHEDHIGGIPYLLKVLNCPVYATKLTVGLIEGKLREHGLLSKAKLNIVKPGDSVTLGCFKAEFIHVNHSIPDSVAVAVKTPIGVIVHTGDFKIDSTPIDGKMIDFARFSELGRKGVLALLMDSTNATRPGFTMSERTVGASLSHIFKDAGGKRIVVATFSSNIHRVQQIVDEAVKCGRKVAVSGRSMINVVTIATELGYLKIPKGVLIDIDLIKNYTDDKLVIITTGSQGEAMSALHRMAFGDHRKVTVGPNDLIVISANPIPGNEKTVNIVINELMKLGAEVVYERMYDVHVSGHACQEELKMMMGMIDPKFFIPVHGEQMHLRKNAALAVSMGIPKENIIISDIGKVIELTSKSIKITDEVPSGKVFVDGLGVGDVGSIVLRDRKHLSEDGIIIVAMTMDKQSGDIISGPELISRGFVYVRESEQLLENARNVVNRALDYCYDNGISDRTAVKNEVRDSLSRFLYQKTRRSPMILPVIMQI